MRFDAATLPVSNANDQQIFPFQKSICYVGHAISARSYRYISPTILYCSWVIKQSRDVNTFPSLYSVESQIEGFLYCPLPRLPLSAIRRSGRLRARGRQEWERRGWGRMNSNCQIREKSLDLKWCSLCASLPARQFLFPHMKTCVRTHPTSTLRWWKVWVFSGHCWMENWHLWLCAVKANPFCLYLLTSIPKRQLAGTGINRTWLRRRGHRSVVLQKTTDEWDNPRWPRSIFWRRNAPNWKKCNWLEPVYYGNSHEQQLIRTVCPDWRWHSQ